MKLAYVLVAYKSHYQQQWMMMVSKKAFANIVIFSYQLLLA